MNENDIADDIITKLSQDDKNWLKMQGMHNLHHSFGTWIRNTYKLWENPWEPDIRHGVDFSENHPDAISSRITDLVLEKLKDDSTSQD